MTEILTGAAAETAASESDFQGEVSPRRYKIAESLTDKAMTLMSDAFAGKWGATVKLAEAFSTSDFKLAAFAAIDSEMLAKYNDLPENWRAYTTVTTVNDFRPKRLLDRWNTTSGLSLVPELTEYPAADNRDSAQFEISVAKYGARFALSWESWKNNEAIQELEDLPAVLARRARETEAINAVSNLIAANRNGTNNAFLGAPAHEELTFENLNEVLQGMSANSPHSGKPMATPPLIVLIPRSLENQANRIKAVQQVTVTDGDNEYIYGNHLSGVEFVVDPFLDYWNTGANKATTWFVLPKPGASRPALYAAFLRGHETPDLRVKADAGTRVGGGQISPLDGSFEIDDIQYRVRHIVGKQTGDATFTYVSDGSGE